METMFNKVRDCLQHTAKQPSTWIVVVLTILGGYLRWSGLPHGLFFHPDERHMVMMTEKMDPRVTLNPESFAYGSLPYYLTRFVGEFFAIFWSDAVRYDGLFIVGRWICIVFGIAAIPLTYWLSAHIFKDRYVGLLSAAFLAINVLHVQLSHFFTADVILTTLALAALCFMVRLAEDGKVRWYVLSAIFCGLALGTKLSAAFLAFPFIVAIVFDVVRSPKLLSPRAPLLILLSFILVIGTFLAVEPYAILDYENFKSQNREQTNMARGIWRPPYTIQYVGTTPYLYPLKQMLFYVMGVPLALAVFSGFIYSLYRQIFFLGGSAVAFATKTPRTTMCAFLNVVTFAPVGELVLLTWIVALYGVTGGFMVKYPRYLLPLYPALFILAAVAVRDLGKILAIWLKTRAENSRTPRTAM